MRRGQGCAGRGRWRRGRARRGAARGQVVERSIGSTRRAAPRFGSGRSPSTSRCSSRDADAAVLHGVGREHLDRVVEPRPEATQRGHPRLQRLGDRASGCATTTWTRSGCSCSSSAGRRRSRRSMAAAGGWTSSWRWRRTCGRWRCTEPMTMTKECPFCTAESGYEYRWWNEGAPCTRCDGQSSHDHKGVLFVACGAAVGWFRRLLRLCFDANPHLHYRCTNCGGRWVENTRVKPKTGHHAGRACVYVPFRRRSDHGNADDADYHHLRRRASAPKFTRWLCRASLATGSWRSAAPVTPVSSTARRQGAATTPSGSCSGPASSSSRATSGTPSSASHSDRDSLGWLRGAARDPGYMLAQGAERPQDVHERRRAGVLRGARDEPRRVRRDGTPAHGRRRPPDAGEGRR